MRNLPFFFVLALFGSAFLSFSIQPILGKMLLPMVGGAPAGWIVALAFFQLSLLAGYGVSYVLGRVSPWMHSAGLLLLYAVGWIYMPPHLEVVHSDTHGIALSLSVLRALFHTIFVPFLALTATTAALQRVFAATTHRTAKDPYYLFVASNIGSFLGLLLYPFLLEPRIGLAQQAQMWQSMYAMVVVLIVVAVCVAALFRKEKAGKIKTNTNVKISQQQRLLWLALSFVPCSLSMGVTTLITADVGGIPLFWVLPLGLYLLTFVLAFARTQKMTNENLTFWHHVAVSVFAILSLINSKDAFWQQSLMAFVVNAGVMLAAFFMVAWSCHQRLAEMRPATAALPQYYFMLALGGALAGCLHAFVIPYVLHGPYEFSLMLTFSLLLSREWSRRFKEYNFGPMLRSSNHILLAGLGALAVGALCYRWNVMTTVSGMLLLLFVVVYLLFALQPKKSLICTLAVFVALNIVMDREDILMQHRNFFGTYRVIERADADKIVRRFVHGTTLHGLSVTDKNGKMQGDSFGYYMRGGPIDDVLMIAKAKNFGVLGLGTGQLACFSKTAKTDFFEIDPDIVKMADTYFPYLKKCAPRHLYIGDGRLEIAKAPGSYDVILQDAFTSDGIPTHLLTHEAFEGYKTKMTSHGIMLFHISNRYLALASPIAATAATNGLRAFGKRYNPPKNAYLALPSEWVAVPMSKEGGEQLKKKGWVELSTTAAKPWTDDRSSLVEVLNPLF